ncbi:MAG: P-loop NTPase [Deltaproteobacteria bacterium]|nr:P-loop NTPase [Deltaproteobacteria bacterium]
MFERRMIIVGGKGGVGRTTVSAALAIALASRGRRVLLAHARCERCNPQLSQLLGCPIVDERIRPASDNLWVVNMNPQAAIREMGMMVLRFRAVYRIVLENRIVRSFLRAVPALDDYSMIGKAWYHTTECDSSGMPRYETVIFDGPATGHLISMLRIPQVILDAVPEGPLTTDARKARALLSDPDAARLLIVTLAEEMPFSEAMDLYRAATTELQIACEQLVVNQLYPEDRRASLHVGQLEAFCRESSTDDDLQELCSATRLMRRRRAINERYLSLLEEQIPLSQLRLPHLFTPQLDRKALEPLVERFVAQLEQVA